ncbi:hypothetical protein FE633_46815, partial [Streptomyces montanus]
MIKNVAFQRVSQASRVSRVLQVSQVSHSVADGDGPAGFTLALEVARELHPPLTRAPELAAATTAPARPARPARRVQARRRTVRG